MESEKCQPKEFYLTLSSIREGESAIVHHVDPGMNLNSRLAELGLYPGERVKMVKNRSKGPVLISVKESTFMLGRGMALKIYVKYQVST